ncbi:acylneuraminate cytidylyltransferase family protein [Desulfobacterales bacterium HSG17]|nr:acylneuraminate cytidylyltransferase family protein [Desulfobacterales bacterium HSG17]
MDCKHLKTIGFIFARGGSKGVSGKNIKLLSGKPLINYSIDLGLTSKLIDRVIVSTDDDEIAKKAIAAGAEVPFIRPAELAQDDSPEWLAWQHAIKELRKFDQNFDIFVSIPTTSPLKKVKDVDSCIISLVDNSDADAVITVCEAQRHPSFNMVVLDNEKYAKIACPGKESVIRRQDASKMYDITTVAYAVRPDFILNADSIFEGRVKTVAIPQERALDIDTEFDFKVAELLINENN